MKSKDYFIFLFPFGKSINRRKTEHNIMDSDCIIPGKERWIMGKRWKALAVFAAFLLSLPTGCGTAEDLNATDTAKEETGAGTDTGGKGETAGESRMSS